MIFYLSIKCIQICRPGQVLAFEKEALKSLPQVEDPRIFVDGTSRRDVVQVLDGTSKTTTSQF